MSVTPTQVLRGTAVAGLVIAWAIVAHYGSAGLGNLDVNAALAVAPIAATIALFLGRAPHRPLASAGLLGLAAALYWLWPTLRQKVFVLYFLQHVGTNLALAAFFGRTLRGPGEALVTRLARMIGDGEISERKRHYTRQVTKAWTLFFLANATVSALLGVFAPAAVWSVFANLLCTPLVVSMFLAEHLWRRRVIPPAERPSIASVVRAWRRHQSARAA
jgi:uncharacterized membrane protein